MMPRGRGHLIGFENIILSCADEQPVENDSQAQDRGAGVSDIVSWQGL
jgi:hypothetical protein